MVNELGHEIPQQIIDRISKLLALGRGSNRQGEVEAAMGKVHELLAKYNLDLATVEGAATKDDAKARRDAAEPMQREVSDLFWVGPADRFLWQLFVRFDNFNVVILLRRHGPRARVVLLGRRTNVIVGRWLYYFLRDEYNRAFNQYKKETGKPELCRIRNDFFRGMNHGIQEKLDEARARVEAAANKQALMLYKNDAVATKDYVASLYPMLRNSRGGAKSSDFDYHAVSAGLAAGKRVNLDHKPID